MSLTDARSGSPPAKSRRKRPKSPGRPPPLERQLLRQATSIFSDAESGLNPIEHASRMLEEARSGGIDVDHLAEEIATYKKEATDRLLRSSRKKYYAALARAYCLYLALTSRQEIRASLAAGALGRKLRKNANMFQEVLRLVIDYHDAEGSRAGARALSRDAGALEWAFRNKIGPKDLERQFRSGEAGLERMYSEMKAIRAMHRRSILVDKASVASEGARPLKSGADAADPPSALARISSQPDVGRAAADRPRWRLGRALRRQLSSPTLVNREVVVRVFIAPDGRRIVRDAYQFSVPCPADAEYERQMEGIGARPVGRGAKRPKV